MIEVKGGRLDKKWEFQQKEKKIYYTNFLKQKYLLLCVMVNFWLEIAQIWDLWFKIKEFKTFTKGEVEDSYPWILDQKSQIEQFYPEIDFTFCQVKNSCSH